MRNLQAFSAHGRIRWNGGARGGNPAFRMRPPIGKMEKGTRKIEKTDTHMEPPLSRMKFLNFCTLKVMQSMVIMRFH